MGGNVHTLLSRIFPEGHGREGVGMGMSLDEGVGMGMGEGMGKDVGMGEGGE
jgi:hypothetical protein